MTRSWPGSLFRRLFARNRGDDGVALVTAVIFVAVASAMSASVAMVAINNNQNANRDRQAGGAQATAEAGVAEAISYIRANGIGQLTCMQPVATDVPNVDCSGNPAWSNSTNPQIVSADGTVGSCVAGQACYQVWIGTLRKYAPGIPPVPGLFRIHSTGYYDGDQLSRSARSVSVDVSVVPSRFPLGIYANAWDNNGNSGISGESLFVAGDVDIKCPLGGFDYAYNIPAAIHAGGRITYGPGNKCGVSGSPHESAACNLDVPFDQDSDGGPLTSGDGCYHQGAVKFPPSTYPTTNVNYPETSQFTPDAMAQFGYQPSGLSSSDYEKLRGQAQTEGTYFTSASGDPTAALTALANAGVQSPVVFYDLPSNASTIPTVSGITIPAYYGRPAGLSAADSHCSARSVTIVVLNGNFTTNGTGAGNPVPASIFVPQGTYSGAGNAAWIGTIFANNISIVGTQSLGSDQCFAMNPPGGALDVTQTSYRRVDTFNQQ